MSDDRFSSERASGFGERLRAVRLQLGLSQAQLAERSGLSARTIRRLEQSADPSGYPATRDLLAAGLDLPDATAAWLFGTHTLPLLPAPDLPLLGRDRELATAITLLTSPAIKVVSIIGPGGVGKSRLALEVASEIAAGHRNVGVVRLGAVTHPADALPAIAAALRVPLPSPGQDVLPALAHTLGRAPSLLVLDNLEHLVGIAPELATLVRITLDLKLLLTSREALRMSGERLIDLAPLDTQGPASPAVRLFLQHVERARPDFQPGAGDLAEIQTICERMSGLPLAIELAAAQAETRSLQRVRAMLDHTGLAALSGDTSSLHTSMASAIEWSWNLLDPADQHALAILSVFPSGFDVQGLAVLLADGAIPPDSTQEAEAARALGALLRKHLVARLPAEPFDHEPRYVLLEPIRLFARERLRAAERESRCRTIHAEYTAARFEGMDDLIQLNQVAEMERIEQAYPDGRAALDWALDTDDVALASRLISALKYAHVFRYRTPGIATQLARLLPRFSALTPHARLWSNYERAELASREGDLPQLRAVLVDILAIAAEARDPLLEAMALLYWSCDLDENPQDALATVDRARALLGDDLDAASPPFLQAWAMVRRGIELHRLGRLDEALAALEAGVARKRAEGNEAGNGPPLAHLGRLLQDLGRPRDAARALIAALDIAASLRDDWLTFHAARWLAALARTGNAEGRGIAARLETALAAVQAEHAYALHPGEPPLAPPRGPAAAPDRALPLPAAIALARALPGILPERVDPPTGARFTGGRLE